MPELVDKKSIITATVGDAVELGSKEYDPVDGGTTLRLSVATKVQKNYKREGVLAAIAEHQAIIAELQAIVAEMDSKGIQ